MRRAFANRIDSTATALIKEARQYGARYLSVNGTIDGILWYKGRTILVDFKAAKTKRTKKQQALVDHGWPLAFIEDSAQLRAVLFQTAPNILDSGA